MSWRHSCKHANRGDVAIDIPVCALAYAAATAAVNTEQSEKMDQTVRRSATRSWGPGVSKTQATSCPKSENGYKNVHSRPLNTAIPTHTRNPRVHAAKSVMAAEQLRQCGTAHGTKAQNRSCTRVAHQSLTTDRVDAPSYPALLIQTARCVSSTSLQYKKTDPLAFRRLHPQTPPGLHRGPSPAPAAVLSSLVPAPVCWEPNTRATRLGDAPFKSAPRSLLLASAFQAWHSTAQQRTGKAQNDAPPTPHPTAWPGVAFQPGARTASPPRPRHHQHRHHHPSAACLSAPCRTAFFV